MLFPELDKLSYFSVTFTILGFFLVRSSITIALGLLIIYKMSKGIDRRVYRLAYRKGQLSSELITVLKIVPFYSVLIAATYYFHLIRYAESSWTWLLCTFVLIFIWNEVWFYGLHRILHHKKFLFIHAVHHRSKVTSPITISCFSFLEQSMHVVAALAFPMILSRFLPLSLEGLIFYSIFQIVVNLLGHMNVEIYPAKFSSSPLSRWFTTPTFHSLHHGRSQGHYGLLTTIPDRMFGTYFEDYPRVQARASRGEGLTNFLEKA
jgi:Delta7-sterol 5-desaturase